MSSVYVTCTDCRGDGGAFGISSSFDGSWWIRCSACDGLGRVWAPGAPVYGCATVLGDATAGEIVTLGNGDQGRVRWHIPRRTKKVRPEITFIGLIEPFTEIESQNPIPYPSCVGVSSVDVSRTAVEDVAHANERHIDLSDPVQRPIAGRLM